MGDTEDEPLAGLSTVAEEAARLVDALRLRAEHTMAAADGAFAAARTDPPTGAGPTSEQEPGDERDAPSAASEPTTERADDAPEPDSTGRGADGRGSCERAACGVCPWCRSAAFVDALPSQTFVMLADLASMAADGLRDFARRRAEGTSSAPDADA